MSKKKQGKHGKKDHGKKDKKKDKKSPGKKSESKKSGIKASKSSKSVKKQPVKATKKPQKPVKKVRNTIPAKKTKSVPKKPTKAKIHKPAPKKQAKAKPAKVNNSKPVLKKSSVSVAPAKKTNSKPADVKKKAPAKAEKTAPVSKKADKKESIAKKNIELNKIKSEENQKRFEEIFTRKRHPDKKSLGVLAISNTIPVKAKNDITPSRIASISHSITNPVKRTDSYAVKAEKEPHGKFELEFVVHASAEMLYEFLSTPSGLSEWFCDDLNIRNGIYTFIWEDQLQQARLLKTSDLQMVRFQWVDKNDGSYFEFRIQRDDLTNDIALIITDFAETAGERESAKLLWHSQIEKLMHVLGSIF